MSLRRALLEHDGRTTATLLVVATRYGDGDDAVDDALSLLDSTEHHAATAASWMIKHWVENGRVLGENQIETISQLLNHLGSHWAALHICQSARFLEIPTRLVGDFLPFFEDCSRSERPFLRAWGTDALVRLASKNPAVGATARARLEAALADPAASVRARAQRLVAEKADAP